MLLVYNVQFWSGLAEKRGINDNKASQRFGIILCMCCFFKPADISCLSVILLHTCVSLNAEHMRVRKLEGKIEQVREMSERPGDGGGGREIS